MPGATGHLDFDLSLPTLGIDEPLLGLAVRPSRTISVPDLMSHDRSHSAGLVALPQLPPVD
jgi:hypothetical protein